MSFDAYIAWVVALGGCPQAHERRIPHALPVYGESILVDALMTGLRASATVGT